MAVPDASDSPLSDAARLQTPLARLLRPLVRLCVRRGIMFPMLCDLLRELFVNVAEYDCALPGKHQTDSRVSLLTGIHRKEVRRLRGAGAPVSVVPQALSRTSRILAAWMASPDFSDPLRGPRPLPRLAEAGLPSFESLVASVTRDLRPRAVLDEWLDRKLVRLDAEDRVVLVEAAFVPPAGDDDQLYYFGRNLHDHMAAAVDNILGRPAPFLERGMHYDGLSEGAVQVIVMRSRDHAVAALQAANREAHALAETDPGGTWRCNFGIYIYAEPMPAPAAPEAAAPAAAPPGPGAGAAEPGA